MGLKGMLSGILGKKKKPSQIVSNTTRLSPKHVISASRFEPLPPGKADKGITIAYAIYAEKDFDKDNQHPKGEYYNEQQARRIAERMSLQYGTMVLYKVDDAGHELGYNFSCRPRYGVLDAAIYKNGKWYHGDV